MSQAALARRAGISPSYLSRIEGAAWERGGPLPADGVLRALARALGLSSTALVALRQEAEDRQTASRAPATLPPRRSRLPYAVSVGPAEVDAAARRVVERNPPEGTLRSAQVFVSDELSRDTDVDRGLPPSYLDALSSALEANPDAMLYRVCAADRRSLSTARATVDRVAGSRSSDRVSNVRTRITLSNPLVLDVLVGDHEVFLAVPDRRGHPHLRAGVVVDDPDFVAAMRDWFDESVWYADVRANGTCATDDHCAGRARASVPGEQ